MASGQPDYRPAIFSSAKNSQQVKASVTDADTPGTFSQQVKAFMLYNAGGNDVHINFDAAATTNHYIIPSGSAFMLDLAVTVIHLICATGESATCYLIGVY